MVEKKVNCRYCGEQLEDIKDVLYLTSFPLDYILYCPKCKEEIYIDYFG